MKNKVCIFIGSRANFGRLRMVIYEFIQSNEIEVEIILGPYDIPEFKEYVVYKIDAQMFSDTYANTVSTASIIAQNISYYFANNRLPDLAIVHGDRFENLGFAMAVSYNHIPLLHTEGGEISGNIDNKIRYAISALSDYHFPVTSNAAENLSYIPNIDGNKIWAVGSPSIDYVKKYRYKIKRPVNKKYILCLYHTADKEDTAIFVSSMREIMNKFCVIWINPNIDPGNKKLLKEIHNTKCIFLKKLPPLVYYRYLYNCHVLVGNTSSGVKEAAWMGVPYVLVGDRQKNRELGTNIFKVKCGKDSIIDAVVPYLKENKVRYDPCLKFGNGGSAIQIVNIMLKELEKNKNYLKKEGF